MMNFKIVIPRRERGFNHPVPEFGTEERHGLRWMPKAGASVAPGYHFVDEVDVAFVIIAGVACRRDEQWVSRHGRQMIRPILDPFSDVVFHKVRRCFLHPVRRVRLVAGR